MKKSFNLKMSILNLGLALVLGAALSACGEGAPAGNGQVTVDFSAGNSDNHLPLIDGEKIHFKNLSATSTTSNLSFVFSIDAGGIISQDGASYLNQIFVLRLSQGDKTVDYAFTALADVNGNLGLNFLALTPSNFPNFDQKSAADFQILYNDIELIHGQIHI